MTMRQASAGRATPLWRQPESLLCGGVLLLLAVLAWAYIGHAASSAGMATPAGLAVFLFSWAVMMVAMMLPAILPLVFLYRATALRQSRGRFAAARIGALLAGYIAVWTAAGLPVYGYAYVAVMGGAAIAVLPGILLVAGGLYQFTALKQACHVRCSNPLFFVAREWWPGLAGALRMGVLHGLDCLGCCAGVMVALVALGMMDLAWMLTAALIIFVEKTLPGGKHVARPLGIALIVAGIAILGESVVRGTMLLS